MATFPGAPTISANSTARILVLTCIDPRFTELTSWFLNHIKQVHDSYDLFALAGSTLGVVQAFDVARVGTPTWPVYANWDDVFLDHVKLAVVLHGITEIWLFDHLGCAAYEQFLLENVADTLPAPHLAQMNKLVTFIRSYTNEDLELENTIKNLKISGFLMNLDGSIRVLLGNPILEVEKYNKQTYYVGATALTLVTTLLIVGIIYYLRNK